MKQDISIHPLVKSAVIAGSLLFSACAVNADYGPAVNHGVAAGDVQSHSAVIWSRTDQEATMHAVIRPKNDDHGGSASSARARTHYKVAVSSGDDYTGKVYAVGLRANTEYEYAVWFDNDTNSVSHDPVVGSFRTAPEAHRNRAVSFGWGGDLAGQNVCRDTQEGFPIFDAINDMDLDFFIGLGDMIYGDGTCEAVGRYGNAQIAGDFDLSANLDEYWAHWKYNREDAGYRHLLASVAYYAIWDDHEVVNDFGPLHDTRDTPPYTPGVHLLPIGLQALLNYNPIREDASTPDRLYRNIR